MEEILDQLRLVVYSNIYDGSYTSQAVVWDFWTINSILEKIEHNVVSMIFLPAWKLEREIQFACLETPDPQITPQDHISL